MQNWLLAVPLLLASMGGQRTCIASSPVPARPSSSVKFALLVGIAQYDAKKGLPPLQGSRNDVLEMRNVLEKNFGFRPENIRVQLDKDATKSGIVAAIHSQLLANAKTHPNGTFLFYYAGHGSHTLDTNNDEQVADPNDKYDETLVPFDSTRDPHDKEHFDIVDDDLERYFREIQSVQGFTGSLTSILDCCFSGTATRGADSLSGVREVAPDTRIYPPESQENRPSAGKPSFSHYTALSACMADEKEGEITFKKGNGISQIHGVLTYYLLQVMRNATATTTAGEIWSQVAQIVGSSTLQNPQLEGRGSQLFLGGATQKTAPFLRYTVVGRTLKLTRGIESGVVAGGFVALYASAPKSRDVRPLKQLQITRAGVGESEIQISSGSSIPRQGVARLLTPYFGTAPLLVGLGKNVAPDNPVATKLAAYYGRSNDNYIRMARSGEKADVFLVLNSYSEASVLSGQIPHVPQTNAQPMGYSLAVGSSTKPLFGVSVVSKTDEDVEEEDRERLQDCLEHYAVQRKILALSNHSIASKSLFSDIKIGCYQLKGSFDRQGSWRSDLQVRLPLSLTHIIKLKVNQGIRFSFANQTDNSLYVAALWLAQDGSVQLVSDPDRRQVINLASKGRPGSQVFYNCQITPPMGVEHIKIFISKQPINVYYLERDSLTRGLPQTQVSPFDVMAGLATGTRTALKTSDPIAFDSWVSQTLTISITP